MGKSTGFESITYFQAPEGSQPFSGLFEPQKQTIIRAKDFEGEKFNSLALFPNNGMMYLYNNPVSVIFTLI